jgi:hypothetical protein
VLERGLNFATVPNKIPTEDIITYVETGLQKHKNKDIAETKRQEVAYFLRRSRLPKINISKEEKAGLIEMKRKKDLVVLISDKGNSSVKINKKDYLKKAYDLINTENCRKIKNAPTPSVTRHIQKHQKWRNKQNIGF